MTLCTLFLIAIKTQLPTILWVNVEIEGWPLYNTKIKIYPPVN